MLVHTLKVLLKELILVNMSKGCNEAFNVMPMSFCQLVAMGFLTPTSYDTVAKNKIHNGRAEQ